MGRAYHPLCPCPRPCPLLRPALPAILTLGPLPVLFFFPALRSGGGAGLLSLVPMPTAMPVAAPCPACYTVPGPTLTPHVHAHAHALWGGGHPPPVLFFPLKGEVFFWKWGAGWAGCPTTPLVHLQPTRWSSGRSARPLPRRLQARARQVPSVSDAARKRSRVFLPLSPPARR